MFALGDEEWPGLSKLVEETGEVLQVAGKLMGSRGDTNHWSGELKEKFIEELGDLIGATSVFVELNFNDKEINSIAAQANKKFALFMEWQETDPALPTEEVTE